MKTVQVTRCAKCSGKDWIALTGEHYIHNCSAENIKKDLRPLPSQKYND